MTMITADSWEEIRAKFPVGIEIRQFCKERIVTDFVSGEEIVLHEGYSGGFLLSLCSEDAFGCGNIHFQPFDNLQTRYAMAHGREYLYNGEWMNFYSILDFLGLTIRYEEREL